MGDVGDYWRDLKEFFKERREQNLMDAESESFEGFKICSPYHWQIKIKGNFLDYWPSRNKWMYLKKMYYGKPKDLKSFIKNRSKN